jgi:hypothetical protein
MVTKVAQVGVREKKDLEMHRMDFISSFNSPEKQKRVATKKPGFGTRLLP